MKSIKTSFLGLIAVASSCVLAGCNSSPSENQTIEITDMLGETITITKNPKKVACISRTTYDLLIAYGLGSKIDGALKTVLNNPWTEVIYPESKNHFKYEYNPNYETIISRGIDLVFSPEKYITDGLKEHGIKAITISLYGNPKFDNCVNFFSNLVTQIWDDESVKANADKWYTSLNSTISEVKTKIEEAKLPKKKLFYVRGDSDRGIGYTDTSGAFTEYAYRMIGFDNYSSTASYNDLKPSIEVIAKYNPDVFICGGIYAKKHLNDIKNNEVLSSLDSVKNDQIYLVPVALTQLEQLNALSSVFFCDQANKLYPSLFEYDTRGMIKQNIKECFGVELTDDQITYILNNKNPLGGELC